MERLKAVHRTAGIMIAIVLIYLSITGLTLQLIDLRLIFTHAPLTDPDMMSMLELQGGDSEVFTPADKTAQVLPPNVDVNAALAVTLKSARATLGNGSLRYLDFRMLDGKLVATMQTQQFTASYDGASGALLHQEPVSQTKVSANSGLRYRLKEFHRMTIYGNWALWINVIVGIALFAMVITGVNLYLRMWGERRKQGLSTFIWVGGEGKQDDWKRAVHRWIGLMAAIFLLVVAFSGEWLAYESLVFGYRMQHSMQQRGGDISAARPGGTSDSGTKGSGGGQNNQIQLLNDADLPAMLTTTIAAERHAANGAPIKAVRIRAFNNGQQGVVVVGEGNRTKQLAFNAKTGQPMSTDPQAGGPGFPFGWDAHQTGKAVHRGSYFGLWARFFDLLAGLSLLYLSINGISLFIDHRRQRQQARKGVLVAG